MRTKKITDMKHKEKALQLAKELLPIYEKYKNTGDLKVSMNEAQKLKELWERYLMGTNLNTTCGTCVSYALTVAYTWYNREVPKTYQTPPGVDEPIQDIKPVTKKRAGRPKKNK